MRIFLYLFRGFTEVSFNCVFLRELLNFSNRERISLLNFKVLSNEAIVRVYTRDERRVIEFLSSICASPTVVKRRGIPEILKKYKHRAGIFAGLAVVLLTLFFSPLFIWEINITGLEQLSSEYVLELLDGAGVSIGVFSPTVDRATVYSKILREAEEISWISVNIQGSSANVEIIERDYSQASHITPDGANIVAAKAGQIVDIDIISGRRVVKDGDVVEKGAILVSGVYDSVKMGTRFTYANAEVLAVVSDDYSAEIALENTRKEYSDEKALEIRLKLFGKSINIFKNYSQNIIKYDIIERKDSIPVLFLDKLPITIETVCALPYTEVPVTLSVEDALERARRQVQNDVSKADYRELVSAEESYTVENSVLYYNYRVEAIQDIAVVSEFSID